MRRRLDAGCKLFLFVPRLPRRAAGFPLIVLVPGLSSSESLIAGPSVELRRVSRGSLRRRR